MPVVICIAEQLPQSCHDIHDSGEQALGSLLMVHQKRNHTPLWSWLLIETEKYFVSLPPSKFHQTVSDIQAVARSWKNVRVVYFSSIFTIGSCFERHLDGCWVLNHHIYLNILPWILNFIEILLSNITFQMAAMKQQ